MIFFNFLEQILHFFSIRASEQFTQKRSQPQIAGSSAGSRIHSCPCLAHPAPSPSWRSWPSRSSRTFLQLKILMIKGGHFITKNFGSKRERVEGNRKSIGSKRERVESKRQSIGSKRESIGSKRERVESKRQSIGSKREHWE